MQINNASQPQPRAENSELAWKQPKTSGTVCVNPQSQCVRVQGKNRVPTSCASGFKNLSSPVEGRQEGYTKTRRCSHERRKVGKRNAKRAVEPPLRIRKIDRWQGYVTNIAGSACCGL